MAQFPKKKPPPKRVPRPVPRPNAPESETKERDSSPEIQVGFAPAGRETLAAITAELTPPSARISTTDEASEAGEAKTGIRQRLRTRGYSEPPPDMPPVPVPAPRMTMPGVAPPANAPATKVDRVSKDTIDALASAMLEPVPPPSSARRAHPLDVFELVTFVVKGDDIGQLSTEATRREFVIERLMHRLPISTVDQIDRVDVTPWTVRGTLILRVWCKVRAPLR